MKKLIRILFFGFTLMELYLLGQRMSVKKDIFSRFFARWFKYKMNTQYGCYLSFKSKISPDCKFIHPVGIVIGEGVVVGAGCQIYQEVTLGAARKNEYGENRYPLVGKNVVLFAGAKVIGGISIGDGAVVGANSVVIKDVPCESIVAGVPAKVLRINAVC